MKEYQREFIGTALQYGALKFGDFTLNSGRKSPYFYNTAVFCSGKGAGVLGSYLANALVDSGVEYDALIGSAYKGIPIVTALSMTLCKDYGVDVDFFFNRKEEKDHGEGGVFVGKGDLSNRRIVMVDDVLTSGKAVTQTYNMICSKTTGKVVCVLLSLDRGEKALNSNKTAMQELREILDVPIISVIGINHIVEYLSELPHMKSELKSLLSHINEWGDPSIIDET